jgi:hypothetical protein
MWLPRFSVRNVKLLPRFSITALLILVAVIAVGLNRVRPMSRSEAVRLAREYTAKHEPEIEVNKIPVVTYWIASHRFWVVIYQPYQFDRTGYPLKTGLPFDQKLAVNHDGRVRHAEDLSLRHDEEGNTFLEYDPDPRYSDYFRGVSR